MNKFFEIKQIDRDAISYMVRNLEAFEKDKTVKDGLKAAGNVFKIGGKSRLRKSMKSGSRGVTGNLLRSIIVRTKRSKPGVIIGFKQGKGGGSHASWIDRGTDERFYKTKKGNNKSIGRVPATRFWSDTESQDHPKAIKELYNGIEKGINRINSRR